MIGSPVALMTWGIGLLVLFVGAGPVSAQKSTLPESLVRVSQQPSVIVNQLGMAITEERRALEGYNAAAPDDDISGPHQAASNAYVLIRAAREGIWRIKTLKKFEDPVLELVHKKVTAAWNRSRAPVDRLNWGGRRDQYLESSRKQLAETIAMLEEILLVWP